MILLSVDGLSVEFPLDAGGGKVRVFDLNLQINDREILGVTGVSGAGKTTLLRCLSGAIAASSGKVIWADRSKNRVSFCPQDDVLLDYRTAWENAVLLLESFVGRNSESDWDISAVVAALKKAALAGNHNSLPSELSGGMRQRLQVIQALVRPSELALLDEPFSEQDRDQQYVLADLIWDTMRRSDRAAVIVSHDVEALGAVCDRVIFLGGHPATIVASIQTPLELCGVGGSARRDLSPFSDFSTGLWQERAIAARI